MKNIVVLFTALMVYSMSLVATDKETRRDSFEKRIKAEKKAKRNPRSCSPLFMIASKSSTRQKPKARLVEYQEQLETIRVKYDSESDSEQ